MSRSPRTKGVATPRSTVAVATFLAVGVAVGRGGVAAQTPRWELDASASRIAYDTTGALNAPSLSSLVEWRRPTMFTRLSGSVTGFEGAGWSAQGRADLAGWLTPFGVASPFRLELAGGGRASRHSSDFESLLGRADARLHVAARSAGGWAGVGGAVARNSLDTASVTGVVPTVGVWARTGSMRATASYLHTRISGESIPEANLVLAMTRGLLDVSLYGGLRRSTFGGVERSETWAGVSGAVWVRDNVALVVSGGQYSADVLQGLPGGEFMSIGIRVAARRVRPIPRRATAPIVYTLERVRESGITLSVPGADRVEIAGDFNGWTLEALERDRSGGWVVPARLEPGVYRFNLRVDGERWVVPDGVPEVEDGYGDRVGLLIISAGSGS